MFSLKKTATSTFLSFLLASSAFGAKVAVIDSGTDVKHEALAPSLWNNPTDVIGNFYDDDQNGYLDDFYGWNFVDNNSKVLDRAGISQYTDDVGKFFEIQYLMYLYERGINKFTPEIIDWYNNTLFQDGKMNPEIAMAGNFYGGYAHGTHVAGIVAKDNPDVEIITAKLIGTKAKLKVNFRASVEEGAKVMPKKEQKKIIPTVAEIVNLKHQLSEMAQAQSVQMGTIAEYVGSHGARVANASFGTGIDMTLGWLSRALPSVADGTVYELALHFQKELVAANKISLSKAPNTLFVAAAGNDTKNIDIFPDSPASIVSDNVISVAATWGRRDIADFSCYGVKTVHVAAPGVGIESAAPGGHYVYMNGTSQAAPYVSKVASMMVDANPELTPKQIKAIIIGTVDVKPWLADKVMSSGIVNLERAVSAAKIMKSFEMSLGEAVTESHYYIDDVAVGSAEKSLTDLPVSIDGKLKNFVSQRPSPISFE